MAKDLLKRTGYEEFCHQLYSNVVQKERQEVLTFFEVERNIIEDLNIREDMKFIDILEQRNIISRSNVDQLLECFNELGKQKLADIVTAYQSVIVTETFNDSVCQDEDEDFQTCKCPTKQDQERLLCLNCSKFICYDCFLDHRNHEVVPEDELDEAVENYRDRVEKELEEVQKKLESCEKEVNIVGMDSSVEEVQLKVANFSKSLHIAMKKQCDIGKAEYAKVRNARKEALSEAKTDFESLSILTSDVSKNVKQRFAIGCSNLVFLQKVNYLENKISKGIEKAKSINETVESVVRHCPAALSARFATITVGPIIGAVRVSKHQVIIVTDQRLKDPPYIHLSCVSCDNTDNNYWSHTIEYLTVLGSIEKLPMIAMGNSWQMKLPKVCLLLGCGRKIIQIEMLRQEDIVYYNSFTVNEVTELPKGSDITCLKVMPSSTSREDVLIIDSVSHLITRLDRELVKKETLPLQEKAYLAAGVFDNTRFIYAYYNGTDIKIINGNSPTDVIGFIRDPSESNDFYPADIFHDFAAFSVLWKKRGNAVQSKVAVYSSSGDLVRICHEETTGRSESIGISYVKNGGLLCLANGHVVLYDTLVRQGGVTQDMSTILQSIVDQLD